MHALHYFNKEINYVMVHQVLEPMVKLFSSHQISTVEVCVCVVSDQKLISFVEVLIFFMMSI